MIPRPRAIPGELVEGLACGPALPIGPATWRRGEVLHASYVLYVPGDGAGAWHYLVRTAQGVISVGDVAIRPWAPPAGPTTRTVEVEVYG
jgi:hypothetical protein